MTKKDFESEHMLTLSYDLMGKNQKNHKKHKIHKNSGSLTTTITYME